MLLILAWRNLWRNRSRTMITMAAVFFAVLLSVLTTSLQDGVFDNLIKNVVSYYSGYIQVHKQGYWNEKIIDNSFFINQDIETRILKSKNVKQISPRFESFALISSGIKTQGGLIIGINSTAEKEIINLDKKLIAGNYKCSRDDETLIGEGISKKLNVSLNDTIVILGQEIGRAHV